MNNRPPLPTPRPLDQPGICIEQIVRSPVPDSTQTGALPPDLDGYVERIR